MSVTRYRNSRRWYLIAIVMLLLMMVGLYFAYRLLVAPPQLVGEESSKKGYRHGFSLYGFGAERLSKPSDVAFGPDGKIYVVDSMNHRIVVYDKRGTYLAHFGTQGTGRFEIEAPSGIAVAPDGTVFVLSKKLGKVVIYDSAYKPVKEVMVRNPQVATVADGKLYLATYRGVMIGDLRGNLITSFGRRGRQPGQVDHPGGIAVGKNGTIFISDTLNYRVQALDSDGKVIWSAGDPPKKGDAIRNRSRRFGLPVGLAMGADELLYLIDAFNGVVLVLDSKSGKELARYGEWGHEEGMLYYPAGIAHGNGRTFAVADKFNDRVQVLAIDSPVEAPLAKALRSPAAWLLPLALLPLLLLLLPKLVPADRAFLGAVLEANELPRLADSVPYVNVTEDTREELGGIAQEGVELDSFMRVVQVRERSAARLAKKHGLSDEASHLLARAMRPFRLRVMLLTDDPDLQAAADREKVTWLGSRELFEHWDVETPRGPSPELAEQA